MQRIFSQTAERSLGCPPARRSPWIGSDKIRSDKIGQDRIGAAGDHSDRLLPSDGRGAGMHRSRAGAAHFLQRWTAFRRNKQNLCSEVSGGSKLDR